MHLLRHVQVGVDRQSVISRRDFFKGVTAASVAAGTLNWTDLIGLRADELKRQGMACILLWMQGGPSQFETFSPKPGHANGGETKAIATNVPGIEVSENFPQIAGIMDRLAIIRSMSSREGNHQRASFFLHTGYVPMASVKHPTLGAILAQQLHNEACQLPAFVRIGATRNAGGGGFLGVEYDPFTLASADAVPPNTRPTTDEDRYLRRLSLLGSLEEQFAVTGGARQVEDHSKLYAKASRMILGSQMQAFDVAAETDAMRDRYGRTKFGTSCLLARRLIESGVTCVEVSHGSWDTHQDNFERVRQLSGDVDQPMAALVQDLQERGMLDKTLVIWMGEFGRTPKINPRVGRDHYPKAFNVVLAGGGIKGGQVIGQTDDAGTEIVDRPVTVNDLFQTFCKSLAIDPSIENMSGIGRPIKIVDGGQPVDELFG